MGINVEFMFVIVDGDDVDMFGVWFDIRDVNIGIIYIVLKLDWEIIF